MKCPICRNDTDYEKIKQFIEGMINKSIDKFVKRLDEEKEKH